MDMLRLLEVDLYHEPVHQVLPSHIAVQAHPRGDLTLPPGYVGPSPPLPMEGAERAIKWEYDAESHKWTCTMPNVIIDPRAFAEGSLRRAHKMLDLSQAEGHREYVAKISQERNIATEIKLANYWSDVQVQAHAKVWAKRFNEHPRAPKKIDFLVAFVLHLIDRGGTPLCGVERFVSGEYEKWSNNWDFVDDRRNTPHAFSHFTFEKSGRTLVVCDVQGVGDLYTDPQIHAIDPRLNFGSGNLGRKGLDAFVAAHRCNAICRNLGLTKLNEHEKSDDIGTCPINPRVPAAYRRRGSFDTAKDAGVRYFPSARDQPEAAKHLAGLKEESTPPSTSSNGSFPLKEDERKDDPLPQKSKQQPQHKQQKQELQPAPEVRRYVTARKAKSPKSGPAQPPPPPPPGGSSQQWQPQGSSWAPAPSSSNPPSGALGPAVVSPPFREVEFQGVSTRSSPITTSQPAPPAAARVDSLGDVRYVSDYVSPSARSTGELSRYIAPLSGPRYSNGAYGVRILEPNSSQQLYGSRIIS